jgi:hypothetical protein
MKMQNDRAKFKSQLGKDHCQQGHTRQKSGSRTCKLHCLPSTYVNSV